MARTYATVDAGICANGATVTIAANNGHVLVVPREHYESLFELPRELGVHLFRVTTRLARAVRTVTGCSDFNIVVNSGTAAGQDEPHYHVHIIPRRAGAASSHDLDSIFKPGAVADPAEQARIAEKIRAAL